MKKTEYYRAIPPKAELGNEVGRHLHAFQKNTHIRSGDIRVLPARNRGGESLWLLVLSTDDHEGTASVCMLHYDELLANDTDVVLKIELENYESPLVLWSRVLGNLVIDDYLTTSFYVDNVGEVALEDISDFITNLDDFDLDSSSYLCRPSIVLCETLNLRLYKRTLINQLLDYGLRSWNLVNTVFISEDALEKYEFSDLEKLIDEGAFFSRFQTSNPRSQARFQALLRNPRISSRILSRGGGFQISYDGTEKKEDFFAKLLGKIGSDFTYVTASTEGGPALYYEIDGQRIKEDDRRLSAV